jgi:hypothetical protein
VFFSANLLSFQYLTKSQIPVWSIFQYHQKFIFLKHFRSPVWICGKSFSPASVRVVPPRCHSLSSLDHIFYKISFNANLAKSGLF